MTVESFRDLNRIAHGFQAAKALLAAVKLDLFTAIDGGCSAAEAARRIDADPRALALLLNALVAIGLVTLDGETYENGPVAASFLVAGESYRGHIFRHIDHCWDGWSGLEEAVRHGGPVAPGEEKSLGRDEVATRDFIRGMDDVTRELAPEVAGRFSLGSAGTLLDVGGGPGTYAMAFLEANPSLRQVTLFDLPGALEVARERLGLRGLLDRVRLLPGDALTDPFPAPVDAVWISQLIHSMDEEGVRLLLKKGWDALAPGGVLAVHDFFLDPGKTSPPQAALFGVHMLVMTAAGRTYSTSEVAAWLAAAGAPGAQVLQAGPDTRIVHVRRPLKD